MSNSLNILLLEDNFNDAELIQKQVLKSDLIFKWLHVSEWDEFVEAINEFKPDIILSDYNLGGFTGIDALKFAKKNFPLLPFIIVTGTLTDETAANTIKKGAWDYVVKERLTHLNTAIKNALLLKKEKEKNAIAREKLKTNEERYRLVFNNTPDGLFISNIKGITIEANHAISEILGLRNEDIIGKNFLKLGLLPNNQIPKAKKILANKVFSKNQDHDEFIIKRKDGSEVYIEMNAHFFDYLGKEHMLGTVRNITNRKQAEEKLQQSYMFNNSLLKTIPFGMDIVDENGTILFQSDNFKELIGKNGIGKKCWELYKDNKTQCIGCPILKGINIGKTDIYESHNVLGGRVFEIIHTGMIYQGKKAMLEIFQDITQRKENENELVVAKEQAEESDNLKTAFLQNISHEIRTPLNAIIGFSRFLINPGFTTEKRTHFNDIIVKSSDQLLSIIDDIISISSIETGQGKIIEKEVNINLIAKTIKDQLSSKINNKKLTLDLKTILPDNEAIIITDATKLTQILTNLVDNALKFTKQGYVNFGYTVKDSQLEFYVADSGIGIPLDMQDKIFNRFRQIETSATREYGGSGLGLSISKSYTEILGGKMWLTSELGKGSVFYFTIPYQKVNPKKSPEISSIEDSSFKFKNITLLIAEDEYTNFTLLEEMLSDTGISIIRAVNGIEAIEICKSNPHIDLVLMDIKMPKMDGYQATIRIKEIKPDLPIIAQTAYSTRTDKNKAFTCGCSDFIIKPIKKDLLIYKINDLLLK